MEYSAQLLKAFICKSRFRTLVPFYQGTSRTNVNLPEMCEMDEISFISKLSEIDNVATLRQSYMINFFIISKNIGEQWKTFAACWVFISRIFSNWIFIVPVY